MSHIHGIQSQVEIIYTFRYMFRLVDTAAEIVQGAAHFAFHIQIWRNIDRVFLQERIGVVHKFFIQPIAHCRLLVGTPLQ
ncbi:hypothetical protein IP88_10785 [alpha proteobacterium AAP81b]|nr:hypothetical protein IP88_10785 [alpha proteobacterium AAP81b]